MIISLDVHCSSMVGLLFDADLTPEQQARQWLEQQGGKSIKPAVLTKMAGYTNHVFLLEQGSENYPAKSVLRLADRTLAAGLCPLASQSETVIAKHQNAVQLGLAPPLIASDSRVGVMWLAYAGEQVALNRSDIGSIREILSRLHNGGLVWPCGSETADTDEMSLLVLRQRCVVYDDSSLLDSIDYLLRLGDERGYFDKPVVPVHGDLNPGNWLHNGQRWWLIDWDYAGMHPMEWDYAVLIVEHGWDAVFAAELLPDIPLGDLAWFCSYAALLSWDWHSQRGSDLSVREERHRQFRRWFSRV